MRLITQWYIEVDEKLSMGLVILDSENLFLLDQLRASLFLQATYMKVKNEKYYGSFVARIFKEEYISFVTELKNN